VYSSCDGAVPPERDDECREQGLTLAWRPKPKGGGVMAIDWTEDLATGISEIDAQHKELFKRINGLLEACNRGQGRSEVGKTLSFLEEYVLVHFTTEENIMTARFYPGYDEHKVQHAHFISNLGTLKQQFAQEGPSVHLILLTNHTVVDWLRNHIRKLDRDLGAFLNKRT
jgi:hemerythrin